MSGWSGWKETLLSRLSRQICSFPVPCLLHQPSLPSLGPSTYIKVSRWYPGDADGLGLTALHRSPGWLDGEALVLQPRDTIQAELHSLRGIETTAS